MAADLGKRLLAEVHEVGLDEILQTVRLRHDPEPSYFGIPPLDEVVNSALAKKSTNTTTTLPNPPILELIAQAPGSGTTQFLYLLTATAILPSSLGGKETCVAIIDTDNNFSITRLVQQLRFAINQRNQDEQDPESHPTTNTGPESRAEESTLLSSTLRHLHIFRPQSQPSLLATLDSLPTYFLPPTDSSNNNNNNDPKLPNLSTHRPLAFIAIDSLPAFHWQTRAENESRAFEEAQQPNQPNQQVSNPTPPTLLLPLLTSLLSSLPTTPLIITNPSHFPRLSKLLTFTSSKKLQKQTIIPLPISRSPTHPFPPLLSLTEAQRENAQRLRAVERARWRVGSNVSANAGSERTAAGVREEEGGGGGGGGTLGFEIEIRGQGVWVASGDDGEGGD